ncbi:Obg-like ATPase [Modicella reniformis]|uniref:Obg-like ATPase homolog n=1 Tax=Modicella reniformis TaxID=1440133 RepID=A0A9P6MM96_9FUNG|nr:Obg-like ATPase [Modicella reniformis]
MRTASSNIGTLFGVRISPSCCQRNRLIYYSTTSPSTNIPRTFRSGKPQPTTTTTTTTTIYNNGQRLLFSTTTRVQYAAKPISKKAVPAPVEKKTLLGRPSNNLKNDRFSWLTNHYQPVKITPAYLTVIDIAGLVRGAAQGEGLGNAFLSHVRSVDALFHLCRGFDDSTVTHVDGTVDPVRDLETIHDELLLRDIDWLEKIHQEYKTLVNRLGSGSGGTPAEKKKKEDFATIEKCLTWIEQGNDIRTGDWSNKEIEIINGQYLLTAKPMIYLINISEYDYLHLAQTPASQHPVIQRAQEWIDQHHPGDLLIPFSGSFENQLALFNESPEDKQTVLDDASQQVGATITSALPEIIVKGREALNLQQFFTAGPAEVRAWTTRKNTLAPQAAGVIHTDFERGFIMAEVMKMDDLKKLGSESAVKAAGKYYSKGKDYIVEDGDLIYFKFNVTNKKK